MTKQSEEELKQGVSSAWAAFIPSICCDKPLCLKTLDDGSVIRICTWCHEPSSPLEKDDLSATRGLVLAFVAVVCVLLVGLVVGVVFFPGFRL